MCKLSRWLAVSAMLACPLAAAAQTPNGNAAPGSPSGVKTACGHDVVVPLGVPPEGSGPVLLVIDLCFPTQNDTSSVEGETYLYYIHTKDVLSKPSENQWQPYTDATERSIIEDHKRLWATNFLDDLSIEATDYLFPNGVVG